MSFKKLFVAVFVGLLASTAFAALMSGKDGTSEYTLNVNSSGQVGFQHIAGERNEDSTTGTDYMVTSPECKISAAIDLSVDAGSTVYNGPAMLCGYLLTVTVGTAAIDIKDNATSKINLPVSFPIGSYNTFGTRFDTSLVVTPGATSTGTLYVMYKPLDTSTNW